MAAQADYSEYMNDLVRNTLASSDPGEEKVTGSSKPGKITCS